MVTHRAAARVRLCRSFAPELGRIVRAPLILAAMKQNRTVAAVALAGLTGFGVAAATLPAGGAVTPAAVTTRTPPPKPIVRTEVIHETVHRTKREKPRRVHHGAPPAPAPVHASAPPPAAAPTAAPAAAVTAVPVQVSQPVATAAPVVTHSSPAATHKPVVTRTSPGGGHGDDGGEHEHEGGDD